MHQVTDISLPARHPADRPRPQPRLWLLGLSLLASCGVAPHLTPEPDDGPQRRLSAAVLSPGFFREHFTLLAEVADLDAPTARARLASAIAAALVDPGALPPLSAEERACLDGLLLLGRTALQATAEAPVAVRLGAQLLHQALGLDPALRALNLAEPQAYQLPITAANAASLAVATLMAFEPLAGEPACLQPTPAASFSPGAAESTWVEEECSTDRWVPTDCSSDTYVDGRCWDEWVPEQCSEGYWYDNGYWEWFCWTPDDCYYRWRELWIWIPGACSPGYWTEVCTGGYWQEGTCAGEVLIPGECTPAHTEELYRDAAWTLDLAASAPASCAAVRPGQHLLAETGVTVLRAKLPASVPQPWRAALDPLLAYPPEVVASEAWLDASLQILRATATLP